MSWQPAQEPQCDERVAPRTVALTIEPLARDLGEFTVRRILPSPSRRMVGPFVFVDHMGPAEFAPGDGINVRPHPHVCLATVTYLFEGEILHRDSLGSEQIITPGAINWMTAGSGIVHSERTRPEVRASGQRLHGLQIWVALPESHEETDPEFFHYPADSFEAADLNGVQARVLIGEAFGLASPVRVYSPTLYVDLHAPRGGILAVPNDYSERALYIVEGSVRADDQDFDEGRMLVFTNDSQPELQLAPGSRAVLLGGEPIGPRKMWWNFTASSPERIERAKLDWKEQRFPKIPGDDQEFIPLPEK